MPSIHFLKIAVAKVPVVRKYFAISRAKNHRLTMNRYKSGELHVRAQLFNMICANSHHHLGW